MDGRVTGRHRGSSPRHPRWARRCKAGPGRAGLGMAGLGMVWRGGARQGLYQGGRSATGFDSRLPAQGVACPGTAVQARRGRAARGRSWLAWDQPSAQQEGRQMSPFDPIGDVSRWKLAYEVVRAAATDTVVTYDELGEALGLHPVHDRHPIQMAMRRAAKELEEVDKRAVNAVPNKGYRIVPRGKPDPGPRAPEEGGPVTGTRPVQGRQRGPVRRGARSPPRAGGHGAGVLVPDGIQQALRRPPVAAGESRPRHHRGAVRGPPALSRRGGQAPRAVSSAWKPSAASRLLPAWRGRASRGQSMVWRGSWGLACPGRARHGFSRERHTPRFGSWARTQGKAAHGSACQGVSGQRKARQGFPSGNIDQPAPPPSSSGSGRSTVTVA